MKEKDAKNPKPTILVVCGPTASGKTSFAIKVAQNVIAKSEGDVATSHQLPVVNILSVDSRQVYQGLDIVTGKDIPTDLPSSIQVYGLDIFGVGESGNLSDYQKYSKSIIEKSIATNTPLIIVGGTGLYLKAITQNLSDVTIPQNLELRSKIENLSLENLQKILKDINPVKYASLNNSDINNSRRLVRAIEVSHFKASPENQSHLNADSVFDANFIWVGFKADKHDIADSIHHRVLERIENGAIEEVKNLLNTLPDTSLPIYSSLGVSQILDFIQGKTSKEQMVLSWTNSEIDYARRQVVWFKKQPEIIWYDKDSDREALARDLAQKISQHHE